MKTFFRITNNKVYGIQREHLGFPSNSPAYIPDDYLKNKEFVIMRTCHGIGDWCIISAIPRLLKQKYPDCKVYIPSSKMLKSLFGNMLNNWGYGTFDASTISKVVFENNPYVDDFIDEYNGEIFHDHYKIFDVSKDEVSLTEQMMRFWQLKDGEMVDTTPDFYPTEKEEEFKIKFNLEYKLDNYSYISVSSTFETTSNAKLLIDKIKEKDTDNMKWLYYGEVPLKESKLSFLNGIEIKPMNLTIREQQTLKINANYNFGNETGMNLWTPKYSKTYVIGNKYFGPVHGGKNEGKLRKRPFKSGNFINKVEYL
tara:strand:+ start:11704 stop:12636 length:933 start_codon:yes stop_codon:yes gene_type:complete